MKKLLTLAAVVAVAASCAKEPVVTELKALVEKEFSASFSDFGTKTSIAYETGVYKVNWTSGDEIAVFDNVDPHTPHIFTASGSGATTTFSGNVNAGATEFYAVYPASSATTCDFDNALVGADIPAFQSPAAGGVAQDALVTVAHTTTSTFFFQHVCSMIKFNISGTEGISAVKIQTNGDEMIAGRASVTIGTEPTGVAGSSKSVTITPASGSTFASGTYYAAILPADYASGISVTLCKKGAGVATKKGSIGLYVERCKGADLGTLAGWSFGKAVHITSAEDLQALWKAGGCADLAENDVVYLDTDVELTKSTRSCEDSFPAIFDGQGHTITVTYAGSAKYPSPFKTVTGTIRNTNFAGSYTCLNRGYIEKDEPRVGGIAANLNGGVIENCHVTTDLSIKDEEAITTSLPCEIGGIVAFVQNNGGTIENCSYNGSISIEQTGAGGRQIFMGGIVGSSGKAMVGDLVIRDCTSGGIIKQANYINSWGYVGGIAGRPGGYSTCHDLAESGRGIICIDNCSSSMDISLEGQKTRCGGIVGMPYGSFLVTSCSYSGNVTYANTNTGEQLVGGIVGFCETDTSGIIENCRFSGKIDDSDGLDTYKSWTGGITSTGHNAKTVIRNCKIDPSAMIVHTRSTGSCGLIAARPNTAITIMNCRIAGTILDAAKGYVVIDSQSALDANPWVIVGAITTAAVSSVNNIYSE